MGHERAGDAWPEVDVPEEAHGASSHWAHGSAWCRQRSATITVLPAAAASNHAVEP
jgi:hypothetical protein